MDIDLKKGYKNYKVDAALNISDILCQFCGAKVFLKLYFFFCNTLLYYSKFTFW